MHSDSKAIKQYNKFPNCLHALKFKSNKTIIDWSLDAVFDIVLNIPLQLKGAM